MKSLLIIALSVFNILLANTASSTTYFLIIKAEKHPALDATEKGIVATLNKHGFNTNCIKFANAQGKSHIATTSIKQASTNNAPLIVFTIGTAPSQVAAVTARAKSNVRVIFASVTDPVQSHLVQNLNAPPNFMTGASNMCNLAPQIALFRRVQPGLRSLGYLYNPGETNSVILMHKIKEECDRQSIAFVAQAAADTRSIPTSTSILAQKVDAIFVSNDNTALSCIPIISKMAAKFNVPLYVSDIDVVSEGAVLAYGPNQYDVGVQAGEIAAKTLKGNIPLNAIPVTFPRRSRVVVNKKMLERFKCLSIPCDIRKDTDFVN